MLEIVLLAMGILAEFLAKTNNNIKLGLPCILSTSPYLCKGLQSKQTAGRQPELPWETAI